MSKETFNAFNRGYMCALATIVQCRGYNTEIVEAFSCNFMTEAQMRSAGIDEYDIEILTPVLKDVERKMKRSNRTPKKFPKEENSHE